MGDGISGGVAIQHSSHSYTNEVPTAKPKKTGKKVTRDFDESEEERSWDNNESDADYGDPLAQRARFDAKGNASQDQDRGQRRIVKCARTEAKGPIRRKIKTEDGGEEGVTPSKIPKRKRQDSLKIAFSRSFAVRNNRYQRQPYRRRQRY